MKHANSFLVLLLSVGLVMLSCTPYVSTASKGKVDFAFVIPCEWVEQPGICLLEKHKVGAPVSLLEVKTSRVCSARTSKNNHHDWAGRQLIFTEVTPSDHCALPDSYSISILGPVIGTYELLRLEEITDAVIIKSIDNVVRHTTVLESLRMKEQPGQISEIESKSPRLFRYPHPNIGTYILAYNESDDEQNVSGPRVILLNGVPYPLTGWCSYPYMRAFRFNQEYYLESGSCCCDCGITLKELFRIDSSGLVDVRRDSSLSD